MSKRNQRVGQWGELAAAQFLENRGYTIKARSVRTPYGEIDLVVEKDGFAVFVEVNINLGPPEISVTVKKQGHMLAAAEHYAAEMEIEHWQIDVVAVEGKIGSQPTITHFENAI